MKTSEIIKLIDDCGGFCNLNHWSQKEISQWVKANYPCSNYVANQVAWRLRNK